MEERKQIVRFAEDFRDLMKSMAGMPEDRLRDLVRIDEAIRGRAGSEDLTFLLGYVVGRMKSSGVEPEELLEYIALVYASLPTS